MSYFLGDDPTLWHSALPTYRQVGLGEVWKGITLSLSAKADGVEKLFTVAPGTSVDAIRLRMRGAESLRVDPTGALVAGTDLGEVKFSAPVAYQEKSGVRSGISVAYLPKGKEYGFRLGTYDPALPVVIDPFLQATYLGGSQADWVNAISVHPATGQVYVTGITYSANFPGTGGGAQSTQAAAFVANLNPNLDSLIQATYLGGSLGDYATAIAAVGSEVYVAGVAVSAGFPGTAGGAQPNFGGIWDIFVARLNTELTRLVQSTYLGGNHIDGDEVAMVRHPATGDIYVAGATSSTDFPGTAGGAQPSYGGGETDSFLARFNPSLTALIQTTYLGGTDRDRAYGVAVNAAGDGIYATGNTYAAFPGTIGGAQPSLGGGVDAYVVRLNASLTAISQSTYLGGSSSDEAHDIAIHPASGEIYVVGASLSDNFPGTRGGAQAVRSYPFDTFVARLNPRLTALLQATYLGGNGEDRGYLVSIHPLNGEVFVAGTTESRDFPRTARGAQAEFHGRVDAFAARLNSSLTGLAQATYIGGSGEEFPRALMVYPSGSDIFIAGGTGSLDFPATARGVQPAISGVRDAFIARLTSNLAGVPSEPIPALSEWKLLALSVLLALSGFLYLRAKNPS